MLLQQQSQENFVFKVRQLQVKYHIAVFLYFLLILKDLIPDEIF